MEGAGQLLLIVLGLGAMGVVLWAIFRFSQKQQARISSAWEQAAQAVGGQFLAPAGPWYRRAGRRIQARLEGVDVLADHYTVSHGKSSTTYTRVRAAAPGPTDLRLKIYREHVFSSLGKMLGFQDVALGDVAFDERFMVKTSDEALARAWVTPHAREQIAAAPGYAFDLQNGEVTAIQTGLDGNVITLEAAMRGAAALGAGGRALLERWREAAAGLQGTLRAQGDAWDPDGRTAIDAERGGVPIVVDAVRDEAGVIRHSTRTHTRLRCQLLASPLERFAIFAGDLPEAAADLAALPTPPGELEGRLSVRSDAPERTAERLNAKQCERLVRLAPSYVGSDGQAVTVILDRVETDPDRFRIAAEIVFEFAAPHTQGPYR